MLLFFIKKTFSPRRRTSAGALGRRVLARVQASDSDGSKQVHIEGGLPFSLRLFIKIATQILDRARLGECRDPSKGFIVAI